MFRRLSYLKLCVCATMIGCATGPKKTGSAIPQAANPSAEETLVDEGVSSQPTFSPSGAKLLFVSAKRSSHALPQVYEKDLASGDERRLTFQNGTTVAPRYHPKEPWIVYASTTDELKENPPLLNPETEPSTLPAVFQQPTEIYIHSLDGLEITRITDRLGFDGEPNFSPDGKQLIWTRALKNKTEVVNLNRATKVAATVRNLGVNASNYVSSPDKKTVAWIEWDKDFSTAKIQLKTGKEPAVEINAEHVVSKTDLAFSPDGKFLTWSQNNALEKRFEIWIYSLETKCATLLVADSGDRRHPTFMPDMKKVAYTIVSGERSRIVTLPFTAPTASCSESAE